MSILVTGGAALRRCASMLGDGRKIIRMDTENDTNSFAKTRKNKQNN